MCRIINCACTSKKSVNTSNDKKIVPMRLYSKWIGIDVICMFSVSGYIVKKRSEIDEHGQINAGFIREVDIVKNLLKVRDLNSINETSKYRVSKIMLPNEIVLDIGNSADYVSIHYDKADGDIENLLSGHDSVITTEICKEILESMRDATELLKSMKYVYPDLKPENILYTQHHNYIDELKTCTSSILAMQFKPPIIQTKLTDFNTAFHEDRYFAAQHATYATMSPTYAYFVENLFNNTHFENFTNFTNFNNSNNSNNSMKSEKLAKLSAPILPEAITTYNHKSDNWSYGSIAYYLLFGSVPINAYNYTKYKSAINSFDVKQLLEQHITNQQNHDPAFAFLMHEFCNNMKIENHVKNWFMTDMSKSMQNQRNCGKNNTDTNTNNAVHSAENFQKENTHTEWLVNILLNIIMSASSNRIITIDRATAVKISKTAQDIVKRCDWQIKYCNNALKSFGSDNDSQNIADHSNYKHFERELHQITTAILEILVLNYSMRFYSNNVPDIQYFYDMIKNTDIIFHGSEFSDFTTTHCNIVRKIALHLIHSRALRTIVDFSVKSSEPVMRDYLILCDTSNAN